MKHEAGFDLLGAAQMETLDAEGRRCASGPLSCLISLPRPLTGMALQPVRRGRTASPPSSGTPTPARATAPSTRRTRAPSASASASPSTTPPTTSSKRFAAHPLDR